MTKPRSGRAWLAFGLLGVASAAGLLLRPGTARSGPPAVASAPARVVAPGVLEGATPTLALHFDAAGRVAEVLAVEGGNVKKGELLARLDASCELAQVDQAQAQLDAAQSRLAAVVRGPRSGEVRASEAELSAQQRRTKQREQDLARMLSLSQSNAVARAQVEASDSEHAVAVAELAALDSKLKLLRAGPRYELRVEAEANVRLAQAELSLRQAQLNKTRLVAPSDGVILRRFVEPGARVGSDATAPALTLVDRSHLYLRAEVDEADWGRIAVGQRGYAVPPSGDQVPGVVARILPEFGRRRVGTEDPRAPRDTRVLELLFELDQRQELPIGLRMDVYLPVR
jgi:HlyD family secretion protein